MPKKVELLIVEPVFENKPKHKNIYLMCTSDDRLISVQGPFENPLYHLMRDVGKKALMPDTNCEDQDKSAHQCNLFWIFCVRRRILQWPLILKAGYEGPDQPAQMRRLIRACVVRKVHKDPFSALCINCFPRFGVFPDRTCQKVRFFTLLPSHVFWNMIQFLKRKYNSNACHNCILIAIKH